MNKQEILNKYENDEDRLLVSKLLDRIELSREKKFCRKHGFFRYETKRTPRKSATGTKIYKL